MLRTRAGSLLATGLAVASCTAALAAPSDDVEPNPVVVEPRAEVMPSLVTTSASGERGSSYVGGVFSGTLFLGSSVLHSHGGEDIFLAHLDRHGRVLWSHAIGSPYDEGDPKVSFSDGRVTLVGMTGGAVDCGQGPLGTWSSETFFVCTFDPRGQPINGGAFPTGRRGSPSRASGGIRRPALE